MSNPLPACSKHVLTTLNTLRSCVDRFIAIRENFPRGPQFAVISGSRHLEDRDMCYVEQIRHPRSPKPLPPAGLHNIVRTSFTSSLLHLHNYTSTSDVIQDIDLITLYKQSSASSCLVVLNLCPSDVPWSYKLMINHRFPRMESTASLPCR